MKLHQIVLLLNILNLWLLNYIICAADQILVEHEQNDNPDKKTVLCSNSLTELIGVSVTIIYYKRYSLFFQVLLY